MRLKHKFFIFSFILLIISCTVLYFSLDQSTVTVTSYQHLNNTVVVFFYGALVFVIAYLYLYLFVFSRLDILVKETYRLAIGDKDTHGDYLPARKIYPIGSDSDEIGELVKNANKAVKLSNSCLAEERSSKGLYKNLVHDIPAMVCRFDRDFRLTFVNDTYQEFFGLDYDILLGKNWLDFIPVSEHQEIKKHIIMLSEDNPTSTYRHETIVNPEGIKIWTQWIDRAIFEKGILKEYQSVGWDITEQVTHEKYLEKLLEFEELSKQIIFDLIDIHKDTDSKISKMLKSLLVHLDVDRTYIFQFHEQEKITFSNTYEFVREGISEEKDNLQNLQVKDFEWFFSNLNAKEPTIVSEVTNLPDRNFEKHLVEQGINALLIVPISSNTEVEGFLGIDMVSMKRQWQTYELNLLLIIGRVLGIVFYAGGR